MLRGHLDWVELWQSGYGRQHGDVVPDVKLHKSLPSGFAEGSGSMGIAGSDYAVYLVELWNVDGELHSSDSDTELLEDLPNQVLATT